MCNIDLNRALGNNRIYHHVVDGTRESESEVAYLWHEGGFSCPCTKWWLIIFLLFPLIAVRNPLFYFRNYYRTFSDHQYFLQPFPFFSFRKSCIKLWRHYLIITCVLSTTGYWRQPVGDKLLNFNKTHGHTCLGQEHNRIYHHIVDGTRESGPSVHDLQSTTRLA